jgi:hypothetical protein
MSQRPKCKVGNPELLEENVRKILEVISIGNTFLNKTPLLRK